MKRNKEQDGSVNKYEANQDPQAIHHEKQNDLSMSVEKRLDWPEG
jgi:hypothetical protein